MCSEENMQFHDIIYSIYNHYIKSFIYTLYGSRTPTNGFSYICKLYVEGRVLV